MCVIQGHVRGILQLSRPFQLLAFSRKSHPYENAIFSKSKFQNFFQVFLSSGVKHDVRYIPFQLLAFSRKSHPYANAIFSKIKISKIFFLFELRRKTRCALYRGMLGEYYAIIQTFSSFSRFQENRISMQTLYFQKSKFQNFF